MNSLVTNNNIYSKKQKQLFFVFILMSVLNFGNYSFLSYDLFGNPSSNSILLIIKNIRPFIPITFLVYLFSNKTWQLKIVNLIKENKFIFLLCFLFLINSSISSNMLVSFLYSVWLVSSIIILGLTVNETHNTADIFKFLKYGTIITLILAISSFQMILTFGNEATFFSSKNYYAYPLLIYFVSELYLFQLIKLNKYKKLRIIVLFFVLLLFLLSGRRTPTFCALTALLIYLFNNHKFIFTSLIIFIFTFGTIVISSNIFGVKIKESLTYKRFERIDQNSNFYDSSYSDRQLLWDKYLKGFKNSPLIGNGLNTFESTLKRYYSGDLQGYGYHNTFLQILVESGAIGTFFMMVFLLKVLYRFTIRNNKLLLLPILFPTFFINWFETNFLPGQLFFVFTVTVWFLIQSKKYLHEKQY